MRLSLKTMKPQGAPRIGFRAKFRDIRGHHVSFWPVSINQPRAKYVGRTILWSALDVLSPPYEHNICMFITKGSWQIVRSESQIPHQSPNLRSRTMQERTQGCTQYSESLTACWRLAYVSVSALGLNDRADRRRLDVLLNSTTNT